MARPSSSVVSAGAQDLLNQHTTLLSQVAARRQARSDLLLSSDGSVPEPRAQASGSSARVARPKQEEHDVIDLSNIPPSKRAKVEAFYPCYRWDEETVRNDLPARYGVTGEWGGNFVAGAEEEKRFDEYPRSKKLLRLKKETLARHSHRPLFLPLVPLLPSNPANEPPLPPQHTPRSPSLPLVTPPPINANLPPKPQTTTPEFKVPHSDVPPSVRPLNAALLAKFGQTRFDTVLINPPSVMSWEEISGLPIRQISADPAFCYLWVGPGSQGGLERGREALARWGFRRCEEIVWVKTNKKGVRGPGRDQTDSIFVNTKEHCLMGIRGTVRRATDGWLVHTNVDTEVIVWEGDEEDPEMKPPEIYSLAENFCLGSRRLDLFGSRSRPRPGWVTSGFEHPGEPSPGPKKVKKDVVEKLEEMVTGEEDTLEWGEFEKDAYEQLALINGRYVYPTSADVENLRPKSPVRPGQSGPSRPHSSQNTQGRSTPHTSNSSTPLSYPPSVPYQQQGMMQGLQGQADAMGGFGMNGMGMGMMAGFGYGMGGVMGGMYGQQPGMMMGYGGMPNQLGMQNMYSATPYPYQQPGVYSSNGGQMQQSYPQPPSYPQTPYSYGQVPQQQQQQNSRQSTSSSSGQGQGQSQAYQYSYGGA